jgi:hypothetical protein
MLNLDLTSVLDKLPIAQLRATIETHVHPLLRLLPDKRLWAVVVQMLLGILGSQTPVITAMARSNGKREGATWATAKRLYRLVHNPRVPTASFYDGLYAVGQQVVAHEHPEYLVVAVDPVNFEKPYAEVVEGVSTVYKATPPDLRGQARLTHGYPAITATIVNTRVPVTTYANWFSYQTEDFVSQNAEILHCFTRTVALYPQYKLRFVGDAGLDDQKMFAAVTQLQQEFVFRVCHLNRTVEVYNDRLDRWETECLQDLTATILYQAAFQATFTHAGRSRTHTIKLGWLHIRLPGTTTPLWVLVADDQTTPRQLVLITNVPLLAVAIVQQVYTDWRLRTRIEHGYRFDQEQGLDVEDVRVHTLDRMRRIFAMVLLTAQLVFVVADQWPPPAVQWLRILGGKLELTTDRDGPYWLLQGIAAVIITAMTLSFVALHPFPFHEFTYG